MALRLPFILFPEAFTSEVVISAVSSNSNCIRTESSEPSSSLITPGTTQTPKTHVETFVFFDLETNGLPQTVGGLRNVQITEISMIAVGRSEFSTCTLPDLSDVRVKHKLSLCIRPKSSISLETSSITGLSNYNLRNEKSFDESSAFLITSFLDHLKKPVCLLAHNGKAFDFPILKAEFEKVKVPLPDCYLADTLVGFRLFGVPPLPPNEKPPRGVKFNKNTGISFALQNLHLYLYRKKAAASHNSEGDCITLAKVCHKVRDRIVSWIDENCFKFDSVRA